ncbi:hypothetical protein PIB30_110288 [Stylosanthes scabra]|uniref:Uncharacterized protein n=1 Tax=Stylosanthes scabra TaxID=79078 RepID=A0ABU6W3T8_9FABA|nr:hypothetical protein [Stylosanthes scabra]
MHVHDGRWGGGSGTQSSSRVGTRCGEGEQSINCPLTFIQTYGRLSRTWSGTCSGQMWFLWDGGTSRISLYSTFSWVFPCMICPPLSCISRRMATCQKYVREEGVRSECATGEWAVPGGAGGRGQSRSRLRSHQFRITRFRSHRFSSPRFRIHRFSRPRLRIPRRIRPRLDRAMDLPLIGISHSSVIRTRDLQCRRDLLPRRLHAPRRIDDTTSSESASHDDLRGSMRPYMSDTSSDAPGDDPPQGRGRRVRRPPACGIGGCLEAPPARRGRRGGRQGE